MKLRLLVAALLLATACHHANSLSTIHLEWRADKVPYRDSILKVIAEKHLTLAFTDSRTERQIGRYGSRTLTTSSDVAGFCTTVFQDRFKALGVPFVESGAAFTLKVDLQQWFAEETDEYHGIARVAVSLIGPDGAVVWTKQLSGKSSQGGQDHTEDNYNETLSAALVDVMRQLLTGRDFEGALLGHEPPPDVVALPAPKLPSGPTLRLVWRGVDESKPMGSDATLGALRAVPINLVPLKDARSQPLAIGRYDNEKGAIVYTPDNVAAFYGTALAESLKKQGARLDPAAKVSLASEIVDLIVVEDDSFKAVARLRFTVAKDGREVWSGVVEGKDDRHGKDHSSALLNEALSNAFADAVRHVLSSPDLAKALR
jgi:hypothetical protein